MAAPEEYDRVPLVPVVPPGTQATSKSDDTVQEHIAETDHETESPRRRKSPGLRDFVRNTLKAWGLQPLVNTIFNKGAKGRSRRDSVVIHIPPFVATAVMARFVYGEHWVVAQMTVYGAWDKEFQFMLLNIGKILNSMVVSSLAVIVLTVLRHEMALGQGTPLAALFASQKLGVGYLTSNGFMAVIQGQFGSFRRKMGFVLVLLICCLLAFVAGPVFVTLMLPIQQLYPIGATMVPLSVPAHLIWGAVQDGNGKTDHQTNITSRSAQTRPQFPGAFAPGLACKWANGVPTCPGYGIESLFGLLNFFEFHNANADEGTYKKPPGRWTVPTLEAQVRLVVSYREGLRKGSAPPAPGTGKPQSRMAMPHHAFAAGVAHAAEIYQRALPKMAEHENKFLIGSQHVYHAFQRVPTVRTLCTVSLPDADQQIGTVSFPDIRAEKGNDDFPSMELPGVPRIDEFLGSKGVKDEPKNPALVFFNVPSSLEANASIGIVVSMPLDKDGKKPSALYGCFTNSIFRNQDLFADQDRFVITGDHPGPVTFNDRDLRPLIHTSYADYLNVPLNNDDSRTVFHHLADKARMIPLKDAPDSEFALGHIETIINGLLIYGLARTAPGPPNGRPLVQQFRNPDRWWVDFFPRTKPFGQPDDLQASAPAPADKIADSHSMKVEAHSKGFGYTWRTYPEPGTDRSTVPTLSTSRMYMIALFVYCGIVGVFVLWSLWTGLVSTSWDTAPEVLALALRSPKIGDEVLPTSVLVDNKPLRQRYCVVAEGRDLSLQPMGEHGEEVPEEMRVQVNVEYR